jgi:hypothetical protein
LLRRRRVHAMTSELDFLVSLLTAEQRLAIFSALTLSEPTSRLSDGTVGYHMRRADDCWRAAIATCLQIPMDDLPDPHIDERLAAGESVESVDETAWTDMCRCLRQHGLTMTKHAAPPVGSPRWIGIVPVPRPFASHSLVMAGKKVLFDPAVAPGVRTFYPTEVQYGYSFQRR